MNRYLVKIMFDNKPKMFMDDYTPTKPLEIEYKSKRLLIKELMELYDDSIRSIYILDRATCTGSNFDKSNLNKLKNGEF